MSSGDIVKLNVGGKVFQTTRSTLTKYDGYFRRMLTSEIKPTLDVSGCMFVDRSPKHFDLILNFLRDGRTSLPESEFKKDQILQEAQYYQLDGLIYACGGDPSEEWKIANLDTKWLRGWRIAEKSGEIIFTSDEEEYNDFRRYCGNKFAILINYNPTFWGDVHVNPDVRDFQKKFSYIRNILYYSCFGHERPLCIISPPKEDSIYFFGTSQWSQMTVKELLEQVGKKVHECL